MIPIREQQLLYIGDRVVDLAHVVLWEWRNGVLILTLDTGDSAIFADDEAVAIAAALERRS